MNNTIRMSTARGAMSIVLNQEIINAAKSMGVTEKQWHTLCGNKAWDGKSRPTVKRLLDQLLYGMIETMGLPIFELPAEYCAAVIVAFVNPCNYFAACSWLGNKHSAGELGSQGKETPNKGFEDVTAQQLFALCCELKSDEECKLICQRFENSVGKKLGLLGGEKDEKEVQS